MPPCYRCAMARTDVDGAPVLENSRALAPWLALACAAGLFGCEGDLPGERRVTLTGRGPGNVPTPLVWVAAQDGDGAFMPLTSEDGVYSFEARTGRYTLAFVCDAGRSPYGEVIYATVDELPKVDVPCRETRDREGQHRWTGRWTGIAKNALVQVVFASSSDGASAAIPNAAMDGYEASLRADTYDLAAVARTPGQPPNVIVMQDLVVGGDGKTDLDFGAGVLTVARPIAMAEAPGAAALAMGNTVITPRGGLLDLPSDNNDPARPPTSIHAVPPAALPAGATQELWAQLAPSATAVQQVQRTFGEPVIAPVVFPPPFSATVTAASRSPLRVRSTFSPYPRVLFYQLIITGTDLNRLAWIVNASAGSRPGRTELELPELANLPGWKSAYELNGETLTHVQSIAITSSRALAPVLHGTQPTTINAETTFSLTLGALPGR